MGIEVVLFQYFISISSKFENISFIHDIKFLTNPEYYTIRERLYLFPLKYLIPKSRLIFTVSEEEKKRIVKYFNLNNDLVKVIYHGVNNIFKPLEQFPEDLIYKVKKKNNLPENYLLYVGRLNIRKNLLNLIKAVHSLENKDIPLVMAGKKDWKFHEVKKLIDQLNLNTRIKFLGFKEGEELACIYALSTIFCFPSLVESFGLPAAEAMAAGIPAVVSNTTSLPEICSDAGSYADPNRPEDIASVVDELLRNKNLYNEKKRLGIERAKLFKWETAAEKILYHIENIGKNSN